jgi:hypothetical protein
LLKTRTTYPRKVPPIGGEVTGSAARADREKEPKGESKKEP